MDEVKSVTIGEYTLMQNDHANLFWIYTNDAEGMGLNEENLKALEALIAKFYNDNF